MTFSQVRDAVKDYKNSLLDFGAVLFDAKYKYKDMVGEGINTWTDFLAQPEIGLSTREANQIIDLYVWSMASPLPMEDVNLAIAKLAASKAIVDPELVGEMQSLTLKDFKERHYDVVQEQDNAPRTYTYMVMKRCNETGTLSKVHGVESDQLEETFKDKIDEQL